MFTGNGTSALNLARLCRRVYGLFGLVHEDDPDSSEELFDFSCDPPFSLCP